MQDTVERHMRRYGLSGNAEIRYIDLVSEVGELGKEILKTVDYGKERYFRAT